MNNTQDIEFSHRPKAGVSVGASSEGGQLFIAFALVNDGTSRNGLFWDCRHDAFSRATARSILNGRLEAARAGQLCSLALRFETTLSAHQFMAAFRDTFKPTPDETDDFLSDVIDFALSGDPETINVRCRPLAADIVSRLTELAKEVVLASARK